MTSVRRHVASCGVVALLVVWAQVVGAGNHDVRGQVPPRVETRLGVGNVRAKLERGEPVTIAFVGGSITALSGWRDQFVQSLRAEHGTRTIRELNAGLSATGSDVAAFRMDDEVLRHQPDLVVLELAVNDAGAIKEYVERAIEGIYRQIWAADPSTDVLMVYFYSPKFVAAVRKNQQPAVVATQDRVAAIHGVPSIDVAPVVHDVLSRGEMKLRGRRRTKPGEVPAFSRDGVHPHPRGHRVYARAVRAGWREIWDGSETPVDHGPELEKPVVDDHWQAAKLVPLSPEMLDDRWRRVHVEEVEARSVELWESTGPGATLEFGFKGKVLKIYEHRTKNPGRIDLRVDGTWLRPDNYRPLRPGPALRVVHVRYEFDPEREYRVSLRFVPAAGEPATPIRLGDLLVLGEIVP